jgi:D-cysteine desulfhydrase
VTSVERPLFRRLPALARRVPHVALAELPTPITRLSGLEASLRAAHGDAVAGTSLWLKHDEATGAAYGGNKVRKLEWLLAQAQARGCRGVLTFGAVGSNHAVATATYAARLGLAVEVMLIPQPPTHGVRRNLQRLLAAGATIRDVPGGPRAVVPRALAALARGWLRDGVAPLLIPPGGSSPVGCLGFVDAGLELAAQIRGGEAPQPAKIVVPAGTMGTAVGLAIGLQLAGLAVPVEAVAVTPASYASPAKLERLHAAVAKLLRKRCPSAPVLTFADARLSLRTDQLGPGYATLTPASVAAVQALHASDGVGLEGTYTGKATAALLADAAAGRLRGQAVLLWQTYAGRRSDDPPDEGFGGDADAPYRGLPRGLWRYFEAEVQPLDRRGPQAAAG